jgi:fucose permease
MAIFEDVQAVTIASSFVVGMLLTLLGSIKLSLGKRLELSDAGVGWLLSALYLALVPMMLVSGVFVDYSGPKWVLFAGSLVTAAALFLLAVGRKRAQGLVAILLMGAGAACLSTGSIVLMPKAFFPGSPPAAALNFGNVFFALGAFIMPPLAEWLLRGLDFRRGMGILAVLCLVPALFAGLAPRAAFEVGGPAAPPLDLAHVLGHPILWLAGLVFLLYGPLESSVGTWGTTYLTHLGTSEQRAALLLSGFWLTFLAGRLGTAFLQHQRWWSSAYEPWLILLLALAAAVCLGNLAQSEKPRHAIGGWLLLGAFLGPIFPTLVGILFEFFPAHEHGTAYGAMFSIGSLGGLVLPPFVGVCVRRMNVRRAMRVPMVMALVLALATLVFGVLKNLQLAQ